MNNRINPTLFSPAALNLVKRLPSSTDPCGEITGRGPIATRSRPRTGRLSGGDAAFDFRPLLRAALHSAARLRRGR